MIKTNVSSQRLFSVPGIADLCSDVLYSPYRFQEADRSGLSCHNLWYILIAYLDAADVVRYQIHVGRRTGEPVLFARSSDADRLAASLNASFQRLLAKNGTRDEACA
jgi:hypothetical protein